jgi:hypothetical protein
MPPNGCELPRLAHLARQRLAHLPRQSPAFLGGAESRFLFSPRRAVERIVGRPGASSGSLAGYGKRLCSYFPNMSIGGQ